MANKQKQLTPFERAAHNRSEGAKRLAGIILTYAWMQRVRQLRIVRQRMSDQERQEWDQIFTQASSAQHEHFGYDA
jgi:hypothetical protein